MSEKKWKIDSRVPHHFRGGKLHSEGFPRRGMNAYEGERMSMRKWQFSKHRAQHVGNNWGYLHSKYIEGLLKKYVDKPYDEMLSEFYAKSKSLRQSRKQCWWGTYCYFSSLLETEHTQFSFMQGGARKYYVDDYGFIRLHPKFSNPNAIKKLSRKQKTYNHLVPVPTFHAQDFLQLKKIYETPDLYVGDYFAVVDGDVRKVPVFTSPEATKTQASPSRKAVEGYDFGAKFNSVFWKYTYQVENDIKLSFREKLVQLELENKPEDAELISRMKRRLSTMYDYSTIHGRIKLNFYTCAGGTCSHKRCPAPCY